jgi:LPXTG-motif cell wall-anchored protein
VTSQQWIWLGVAGAGVLLAVAAVWFVKWRKRGPLLAQALHAVAIARLHDVLVPDGMGGQIHIEHLLLTANGLLVIDVKAFSGSIFASDRMQEWTVIGQRGRFTFPNPQTTLYDRVAALRQLVRDVPVNGHVLFCAEADFSKGRPRDVVLPAELMERYRKPERAELERLAEAFAPQWDEVKAATEPIAAKSLL